MSPRPKGRKNLKSEETRERIYTAAMSLFQHRGFADTTMRDIAGKADMATGAAYYYFRSKDDIVQRFYRGLQAGDRQFTAGAGLPSAAGLEERLKRLILHKLAQMQKHRAFLAGVFRNASDPRSPLSPFSEETRDIREANIACIEQAVAGSGLRVDPGLARYLPRLLWYYQMGIILFWFYDSSPGQAKSRALLDKTLKLLVLGIRFFGLPLLGPLRKAVLDLLESFMGLMENGRTA